MMVAFILLFRFADKKNQEDRQKWKTGSVCYLTYSVNGVLDALYADNPAYPSYGYLHSLLQEREEQATDEEWISLRDMTPYTPEAFANAYRDH